MTSVEDDQVQQDTAVASSGVKKLLILLAMGTLAFSKCYHLDIVHLLVLKLLKELFHAFMDMKGQVEHEGTVRSKKNEESVCGELQASQQHVPTALASCPRDISKYSYSFRLIKWPKYSLFSRILLLLMCLAGSRKLNRLSKNAYEAYQNINEVVVLVSSTFISHYCCEAKDVIDHAVKKFQNWLCDKVYAKKEANIYTCTYTIHFPVHLGECVFYWGTLANPWQF